MTSRIMRPMLAAQKYRDAGDLWGPAHEEIVKRHIEEDGYLMVQPKWDGMRAVLWNSQARSRSWKPLANQSLQSFAYDHPELQGLDCEVFSGHQYGAESFRAAMSDVRSAGGSGNLTLVFFDYLLYAEHNYHKRMEEAIKAVSNQQQEYIGDDYHVIAMMCPSVPVYSIEEIYQHEAGQIELGFEGSIVRRWTKPYKYNRATALGGELVKVKRGRLTCDAVVEGYEEGTTNKNEAQTSALGFTTRSSHKEGKLPNGRLGALHVRFVNGPYEGVQQKVGVFRGLTHGDLEALWNDKESLPGRYCELSVDSATGGYDAGRCPVWLRWREEEEF